MRRKNGESSGRWGRPEDLCRLACGASVDPWITVSQYVLTVVALVLFFGGIALFVRAARWSRELR
jgi:hypothetical protein